MNINEARPLEILVYSPSEATIKFLDAILNEFHLFSTTAASALKDRIQEHVTARTPIDFIVLDDQTEGGAERLTQELWKIGFKETKVIHLYTPTISRTGQPVFPTNKHPSIFRLTKPPRKSRVLQVLAELKNLPNKLSASPTSELTKAIEEVSTAQRTLYGNVLIAEGNILHIYKLFFISQALDNPIAQNLLVKQLERYDLNVTATNNGDEAIIGTSFYMAEPEV